MIKPKKINYNLFIFLLSLLFNITLIFNFLNEKNISNITLFEIKNVLFLNIFSFFIIFLSSYILHIGISFLKYKKVNFSFINFFFFLILLNYYFHNSIQLINISYLVFITSSLCLFIFLFIIFNKTKTLNKLLTNFIGYFSIFYTIVFFISNFDILKNKFLLSETYHLENIKIANLDNLDNPNIYLIVFDGLENLDHFNIIKNKENFDVERFKSNIKNQNFKFLPRDYFTNYTNTSLALSSLLNMKYFEKKIFESRQIIDRNTFPNFFSYPNDSNFINFLKNNNLNFIWYGNNFMPCRYKYCPNFSFLEKTFYTFFNNRLFNNYFSNHLFFNYKIYLRNIIIEYIKLDFIDANEIFYDFPSFELSLKNSKKKNNLILVHHLFPHYPYVRNSKCQKIEEKEQILNEKGFDIDKYNEQYICSLSLIENFTKKINKIDTTEKVVIIFSDHGWVNKNKPFAIYNIPTRCKKLDLPKSSVNLLRFALNCAHKTNLNYKEDIFKF